MIVLTWWLIKAVIGIVFCVALALAWHFSGWVGLAVGTAIAFLQANAPPG